MLMLYFYYYFNGQSQHLVCSQCIVCRVGSFYYVSNDYGHKGKIMSESPPSNMV